MKNLINLILLLGFTQGVYAQCTEDVPTYYIDLSANADTTWTLFEADAASRAGQCCGVSTNQSCIRFEITLNSNSAGIFFDYDGAGAFGALTWRVNCGAPHNLKDTICVSDPGPFTLSFCKSGNDNGNYTLISIPKPTFPDDQFVPRNCIQPVEVLGVSASTVTWQSISPGTPGQYNNLLSCTNCLTPTFTPNATTPAEIQYNVCGYPILTLCSGNFQHCDTVKFTIQDSLLLNVTPVQPAFCSGGSTLLTAQATGGDGVYNYIWYNSSLQVVGTGQTYLATAAGSYTCEVRDGNYEPGFCDDFFESVTVVETFPPQVNAGTDQVLCASSPIAQLSGIYQFTNSIQWSGGTGTFSPNNTQANTQYIPSEADIAAGSVILTFSSIGVGGGCSNTSDQVQLFFIDTIETNLSDMTLLCKNGSVSVNPVITGGMAPFNYSWSNGMSTAANILTEGSYCLNISDANGCQTTECIFVNSPSTIDIVTSSTPTSINGGSDGSAAVSASGGVAPYSYLWNTGATTANITNLSFGIYTVTLTDANGCIRLGSVVVNEPQCNGFYVSTTSSNVSCFEGSNGTATATTNGGVTPFSYSWNDGLNQTTPTALNLGAGVYTIVVSDRNGCLAVNTATVNEPDQLISSTNHINVSIQGGNDGEAEVNILGGTGSYTYLWSNGSTSALNPNLTAGWYSVDVTDQNGCSISDSVYVNEPPCNLFYAMVETNDAVCNGTATGQASVNFINGQAPYSISWSTGETNVTSITNLAAGIHSVQVIDAQGCQVIQTYGVAEPSVLSIGLNPAQSSCYGSNDATIDASITGGTYPYYYYNWSNGATTEDLINLAPGIYSVTIEDENGCQASAFVLLNQPDSITMSSSSVDVTCFGYSDASIDVQILGGTSPFSYQWSNGATSQDLTGIDVGGYILNVTDANGCTPNNPLTVFIEQPMMVEAQNITVACPEPGSNLAEVTVIPSGGNSMYSVSHDGGVTFGGIGDFVDSLIVDAQYSIVVSDSNNCLSAISLIDIDSNVAILDVSFNTCYVAGQTQELVNVNISGGQSNYSLSSDNGSSYGSSGLYSLNLPINSSYQLIAMDANGCLSETETIGLPAIFSQNISVTSDYNGAAISCAGLADGEASVVVSGGTGPFIYDWSNGQSGTVSTGLTAGNYSVVITDSNGCQLTGSITLTDPSPLILDAAIVSDFNGFAIQCKGSATGEANASVSGGVMPYIYSWSNGVTVASATNLSAGTYSVVVSDANGCLSNGSVVLTEPDSLQAAAIVSNVSCFSGSNGAINASVQGGVLPYSFTWNNGASSEDLNSIATGIYSLTITDANNCIYAMDQQVTEPEPIALTITSTPIACNNEANGALNLGVNGGTIPFVYTWSNGETTQNISGLSVGSYTVTATDANGCSSSLSGFVNQPDTLSILSQRLNASCYGESNGALDITVLGGTEPYIYNWSTGNICQDLTGLSAGQYSVSIIDANGCSIDQSFTLTQPDPLVVHLSSPEFFHGYNISMFGAGDGSIDATVAGGTAPYYYTYTSGEQTVGQENLGAGIYYFTCVDSLGCKSMDSIKLTEPLNFELPTLFTPNEDGENDVFDIHGIEAYPDNTLTVVNRWGNTVYTAEDYNNTWKGTHSNGEELPDGVYFVILKINGGEIERNTYVHIKKH